MSWCHTESSVEYTALATYKANQNILIKVFGFNDPNASRDILYPRAAVFRVPTKTKSHCSL
jgi:hypothetical protein